MLKKYNYGLSCLKNLILYMDLKIRWCIKKYAKKKQVEFW